MIASTATSREGLSNTEAAKEEASCSGWLGSRKLKSWTMQLYQELLEIVDSRWHSHLSTWEESVLTDIKELAVRVKEWLENLPGRQADGSMSYLTKLSVLCAIGKLLNWQAQASQVEANSSQITSCIGILLGQLKIQMAPVAAQKKGLQKRRIAQRRKHRETINFQPLHEYAHRVLSSLEHTSYDQWEEVSVALAIATGRRLAEIHNRATCFEYVDQSHVKFTGQAKLMGKAAVYFQSHPSYIMPVLVDGALVVKAHQWLKERGLVVELPSFAKNRFGNRLGQLMKQLKQTWGIEHPGFTYKGLRSVYAEVCNQVFNAQDQGNTLYVADILGLGRGQLLTWDLITDTQTPLSYLSDFRLTGTDCVCQPKPETKDLDNSKCQPNIYIQEGLSDRVACDRFSAICVQDATNGAAKCDRFSAIYVQQAVGDRVRYDRPLAIYIQEALNEEVGCDRTAPIYVQDDTNKQAGCDRPTCIYVQDDMNKEVGCDRSQNISIQDELGGKVKCDRPLPIYVQDDTNKELECDRPAVSVYKTI